MKRFLLCLLILTLLSGACAQAEELTQEAFEQYLTARFRARKVACGAVVISKDGEIVCRFAYGSINSRKTLPAHTDTIFRVASVTKLVSAIGLMRLYDQGLFDLDAPAERILGVPVENPKFKGQAITPRQILSHTSGLKQKNYYLFPWKQFSASAGYYTKERPGAAYQYSNLNGGLIGSMIELLSGQSVFTYMRENVFDPLGVTATYALHLLPDWETREIAYVFSKDGQRFITPKKYCQDTSKYRDEPDPENHLAVTVGNLFISAEDLNALTNVLLLDGEYRGVRILSGETVRLMEQDQAALPGSSVTGESRYGLSLARVTGLTGGTWYGHQGLKDGLSADAFYQRETGLAVVVIGNGYAPMNRNGVVTLASEVMEYAAQMALDGAWK